MKYFITLLACCATTAALAATPVELLSAYQREAAQQHADFQPAAQRGRDFYQKRFGVSEKLSSCASCHTDNPAQAGKHVVTDKPIDPLAPSANAERLTDKAKAEKWFRRNCKEVVGRECSAAEKADFVAFLTGGR